LSGGDVALKLLTV